MEFQFLKKKRFDNYNVPMPSFKFNELLDWWQFFFHVPINFKQVITKI